MPSCLVVLNITDANVTVIVSDMDKAIKFYTEILGLKLISRSTTGFDFAVIQAPGLTIGLNHLNMECRLVNATVFNRI
jgi:catechol 2,3-dioxygenase-like lactoylglutathione lyase family enzyme